MVKRSPSKGWNECGYIERTPDFGLNWGVGGQGCYITLLGVGNRVLECFVLFLCCDCIVNSSVTGVPEWSRCIGQSNDPHIPCSLGSKQRHPRSKSCDGACAEGAVSNQALFEQVPVVESLGSEQLQRFVASD